MLTFSFAGSAQNFWRLDKSAWRTGSPIHAQRRCSGIRLPRRSFVVAVAGDRALWADKISKTNDGEKFQFKNITLSLQEGTKVALLGANGVGKSTLLHVLAGLILPDTGEVQKRKGMSLSMVSQDLPTSLDSNETVFHAVLKLAAMHTSAPAAQVAMRYADALYEVDKIGAAHGDARLEQALSNLSKAASAMEREVDAWGIDSYLRNVLTKLSMPLNKKVKDLSGGQQRRVGLAAALVSKPRILLLDEPTNHLSLEGIEFLEEALQDPRLTVLCISHDRYFVDAFAEEIWELDGDLYQYGRGYATFLESKASRVEKERQEHENLVRTYKKELAWVRKQPKARGTKAKARLDAFEALENDLAQKKSTSQVQSLSTATSRLGKKVLDVKNVTLRRSDQLILNNFSYEFYNGERVGICGGNGVGKSSLLRAILGQIPIQTGVIDVGETVVFGHFDQDGIRLPERERVFDYISKLLMAAGGSRNSASQANQDYNSMDGEAQIDAELARLNFSKPLPRRSEVVVNPLQKLSPATLLDRFGFARSQWQNLVSALSGGERRRIQLIALLLSNANCMLLDECSNDIDIRTLSMLEEMLDEFQGTLIMVSHDRFMLDRLVDHLIVLHGDGVVERVEGKFTEYLAAKRKAEIHTKKIDPKEVLKDDKKSAAKKNAPKRLSFRERKEYENLEKEVALAEERHAEISRKLETDATSAGYSLLSEWTAELAKLDEEIHTKTERWLALAERADL